MGEGHSKPRNAESACATPVRSCPDAIIHPEFTLSAVELITACRAPSASTVTLAEGGTRSAGSMPNVIVCGTIGSGFVYSTVSPT